MFNNKTILITGGTGSFGKAFADHLLKNFDCKKNHNLFKRRNETI